MNNNHFQSILNVRYQTELLEALGWDEQMLAQLFDYLNTEFNNFNIKRPGELLNSIEFHFGESVAVIIKKIFAEQFSLIVDNSGGKSSEH
tara:strand:+ start:544 stop:813 length:270 start_codon:yes stop_codon:yes gene_type:complete